MAQSSSEAYRLSPQQERLWLLQRAGGTAVYCSRCLVLIEGDLDAAALARAWREIADRHEILRTTLRLMPGLKRPVQQSDGQSAEWLPTGDLAGLRQPDQDRELDSLFAAIGRRSCDADHGAAGLLQLVRLAARRHALLVSLPAHLADAQSLANLVEELAHRYAGAAEGAGAAGEPVQYAAVADWFNELLESPDSKPGRQHWREGVDLSRLADLRLPAEGAAGDEAEAPPETAWRRLPAPRRQQIEVLAAGYGATLPALLLCCWQVVISRLSGVARLVVAVACSGRTDPELEAAIGPFVRYLPVACDCDAALPFADLLQTTEAGRHGAEQWQECFHWDEIEPLLAAAGAEPHFPFAFDHRAAAPAVAAGAATFALERLTARSDRFKVRLSTAARGDSLDLEIDFDPRRVLRAAAERLLDGLDTLLTQLVALPEAKVGELAVLSAAETERLLHHYNRTAADLPQGRCLHQLFDEQATRSPHQVAVACEGGELTYQALRQRSNQLAHRLRRLGVGSEGLVAICADRSPAMVIGILGVLKAGGAYLPLDPEYPSERLAFMLADAAPRILLTRSTVRDRLPQGLLPHLDLDAEETFAGEAADDPPAWSASDNLAYVIYTSGSTGRPKGVMIRHHSIVNRLLWMVRELPLDAGDRVLQKTPFSFDASIWEIFAPLLCGARLVMARPGGHQDSAYLVRTVAGEGITTLQLVPSQLRVVLDEPGFAGCSTLRRMFCGGEALPADLVARFHAASGAELHNLYGPTEVAIDATHWSCERGPALTAVPIGRPIANVQLYLLDAAQRLVPEGVAGEIHVGGAGLARGYLARPALTAERFVPHFAAASPGLRLYRTGDLGRYLPDGSVEFLGRVDQQVKLRGFRIELGEIEACLRRHPGVRDTVVVARDDDKTGPRLVAYVVPRRAVAGMPANGGGLRRLPNGLAVHDLNRAETDWLFHEVFEQRAYLQHGVTLRDGDCVFDVGANIGLFSLFAHLAARDVRIFAFEPSPPTFEKLRANVALHGIDAELFECGLADRPGVAEFTFYPRVSASSGFYADAAEDAGVTRRFLSNQDPGLAAHADDLMAGRFESRVFMRPLRTLSEVIREQGVERIDCLKLDAEKSEHAVLRGIASEDWPKVRQIAMEVHDIDGRLEEIAALLKSKGFAVATAQVDRLAGTGLYDLYAVHPARHRDAAAAAAPAAELSPRGLREHLAAQLPEHMVPAVFVFLPELPRTPGGKIDRRALPAPELARERDGRPFVGPRDALEQQLQAIWQNLLGIDELSVHDGFFALGGHSLLATRLVAQLREAFGLELPLRTIFEAPTVAELAARIAAASGGEAAAPAPPIVAVPRGAELPLSFAQQRIWFFDRLEPGTPLYNIPLAVRLEGILDAAALAASLAEIVQRHESLRTTFVERGGRPVQAISREVALALPLVDLGGLAEAHRETRLRQLVAAEARRPFDLGSGPLLRATLLRLSPTEHVAQLTMHHMVADGWSSGIVVRELSRLYDACLERRPSPLPALPVQYADYAVWQRGWLAGAVLAAQTAFWQERLADAPDALNLPADRPRPSFQRNAGARQALALPDAGRLHALAQSEGVTPFMLLLGVFSTLLQRYSGQTDLLVGTPVANRGRREIENVVGLFVNTLVLRLDLAGEPSFRGLLRRMRDLVLAAHAHQDLPFEMLVETLRPERSLGRSPIFQVMFAFDDLPADDLALAGLRMRLLPAGGGTTKFDLDLALWEERGGSIRGSFEYDVDLFDAATIGRMAGHFARLAEAATAAAGDALTELAMLAVSERHQLLVEWNDSAADFSGALPAHRLFEGRARRAPKSVAVRSREREISYGQLDRWTNQLARHLRRLGVGPEVRVAVLLERSARLPLAVLAVLKAGGAYVPVAAEQAADRLAFMLVDCGAAALVSERELLGGLRPPPHLRVVDLDGDWGAIAGEREDALPDDGLLPDNAAYLIYTSGSTGRPKGVVVSHAALTHAYLGWERRYRLQEDARCHLQMASFSFDVFSGDLVRALCSGGRLVICPREALIEPAVLYGLMVRERVDCGEFVPAVARALVDFLTATGGRLDAMRLMIVGSDTWYVRELEAVRRLCGPRTRLISSYGVSEATIDTTYFERAGGLHPSAPVPIGRPFPNDTVFVLDAAQRPLPAGAPGELYIGGGGLARGYHRQAAATAERFVPAPPGLAGRTQQPGERLYRTGDLARFLAAGEVEFLGRADRQVKVRGFRIEPGEIEAALEQHPRVRRAVIKAHGDDAAGKRLVAYVVPMREALAAAELRGFLTDKLPAYMMPASFLTLSELPLTANGKVDYRALPAPDADGAGAHAAPPSTPTEEVLAAIWEQLLQVARVGVDDRFFDLGGHSLLATQLVSRVRQALGVEMPLRSVFDLPSLAAQARLVDSLRRRGVAPIRRVPRAAALPLSFAQQRMWFLYQMEPDSPRYNISSAVVLHGALDGSALAASFAEVVRRHEILRTTYANLGGTPLQRIAPPHPPDLLQVDLRRLPPALRHDQIRRLAAAEAQRTFDLAAAPPLRIRVLRTADAEHVVIVTMHHIASDGWSMSILVKEVSALYAALAARAASPLPELAVQYVDFAAWQRERLQGDALRGEIAYWRERLAGAAAVLELPADRQRSKVASNRGSVEPFHLPRPLVAGLRTLGRQRGTTLFMALLAGFQALLCRYTGRRDLCVGTIVAGRDDVESERLIGFFANTLVLRTSLTGSPGYAELLDRVREVCLGAYAHRELPFERLVEELEPERSLAHTPLFQVMLVLQNTPDPSAELPGLSVRPQPLAAATAKFDLSLGMEETAQDLAGGFEFTTELFDRVRIARLAGHLQILLEGMVAGPERGFDALPLLSGAESRQLLLEWNDTRVDHGAAACLHQLFAAQAARTPDTIAVSLECEWLSYRELDRRADRLAHRLRASGVGPEALVALFLERSLELVVAILGVLKAGGAYVPLDPEYPRQRLQLMLEASRPVATLTVSRLRSELPATAGGVHCLDGAEEPAAAPAPAPGVEPANLAYVLFTSGSTGRPKGVMIPHASILNHMRWMQLAHPITSADCVLLKTPISFDPSVWEIFAPLFAGGRIAVAPPGLQRDPAGLLRQVAREQVTILQVVPSLLQALVAHPAIAGCPSLRRLYCGGEALPAELKDRFLALHAAPLINVYGPTEVSIHSTSRVYRTGDGALEAAIGRPIHNLAAYVVDDGCMPVPTGVSGELRVGGASLARGYLDSAAGTAERFVPDPFSGLAGARLYRTGDLVRWQAAGELSFLGRVDRQLKVRGFRIEPAEIEAALIAQPGILEAVVVARQEPAGEARLTAYLVPAAGASIAPAELRQALLTRLPEHMLPGYFVSLDRLPLLPNGKLDRGALPRPAAGAAAASASLYSQPTHQIEALVAVIFGAVLGAERVGGNQDFFDLGGHSLLAMQVTARLSAALGMEVPVREIFEQPTAAGLARRLEERLRTAAGSPPPLLRPMPRDGDLPLSFAQQRLWFLQQLAPHDASYNMPIALRASGALHYRPLHGALIEIARRHELLRSSFVSRDGVPVQVVHAAPRRGLAVLDLSALPRHSREREAIELARAESRRPFDLAAGSLWRAAVVRLASDDHMLLLTLHHIAGDGGSLEVLVGELAALYEALAAGRAAGLPALPLQYADFAAWQRGWLTGEVIEREVSYWRRRLGGAPPLLALPVDRPRPAAWTHRGAAEPLRFAGTATAALRDLGRRQGATLYMTFLAAWKVLLSRYTGDGDVSVGTPVSGRSREELEPMIGPFINTLVVRTESAAGATFGQLLEQVRERLLEAIQHQDLPFEKLVEELEPRRDLGHSPLFQVMFTLQNAPRGSLDRGGVRLRTVEVPVETTKFDLSLGLLEGLAGGDVLGNLEYSPDLFDAATVSRMIGHLQTLIAAAAADTAQRLADLPLLTGGERDEILRRFNPAPAGAALTACAHELFSAQASRTPDAVAAVCGDRACSYHELDLRSSRLAERLRVAGAAAERLVGVCMERSIELLVGVLAILKTGGAYLPLDPGLPRRRLAQLLADAGTSWVLASASTQSRLRDLDLRLRVLTGPWEAGGAAATSLPEATSLPRVDLDHLAYVIYTSGSTGIPKGVAVPHRALTNYLLWCLQAYPLAEGRGSLVHTSPAFDLTITGLLAPLLAGRAVEMLTDEPAIAALGAALRQRPGFSVVKITPAHLDLLIAQLSPAAAPAAATSLVIGGEDLAAASVHAWRRISGGRVFNEYGPTEAAVGCCVYEVPEDGAVTGSVPIGRPILNARLYLLDRAMQPVPYGVAGELYIGAAPVARGYLHQPGPTAERFLPDFLSGEAGARLYRTGDLARHTADLGLEFLGRVDRQLKVAGFRIEPGEIEAALRACPGVADAVVVAREQASGLRRLAAYVVPSAGHLSAPGLRALLQESLPGHMVPDSFTVLAALPLTANGKVDRLALPAPAVETVAGSRDHDLSLNPVEEVLAGIWAAVLGVEGIGRRDDFFELGGHSLLVMQVVSRTRQAFGVELSVAALFRWPVLEQLAARIEEAVRADAGVAAPPIVPVPRDGELRLSYAQERLWFLDQAEPLGALFNLPAAVRLEGPLQIAALERSLREVVRRHENLRTRFVSRAGKPRLEVVPAGGFRFPCADLSALPEPPRQTEMWRLVGAESHIPFVLSEGPLLRAAWLRLGDGDHVLLLTLHHIVSDFWSIGVLVREIAVLYEAFSQGSPSPLPELPIQYADFAAWERRWLTGEILERQLGYWRHQLDGAPRLLALPTDRPRPERRSFRGATVTAAIPAALAQACRALARRHQVSLFMTLLAAFQVVMHHVSGLTDLVIGTDAANRNRIETEGLAGFFVNQLPLRAELSGNPSFVEILMRARDTALGAYAHQDLPFGKLVDALDRDRDLSRSPLFQVKLHLEVLDDRRSPRLAGIALTLLETGRAGSELDLNLSIADTGRELHASLDYSADVFDAGTAEACLIAFVTVLGLAAERPDIDLQGLREALAAAETERRSAAEKALQQARTRKLQGVRRRGTATEPAPSGAKLGGHRGEPHG
jgi:amino acid adenylation domain-containing protein/FkbM family methyltransferase